MIYAKIIIYHLVGSKQQDDVDHVLITYINCNKIELSVSGDELWIKYNGIVISLIDRW